MKIGVVCDPLNYGQQRVAIGATSTEARREILGGISHAFCIGSDLHFVGH